MKRHHVIRLVTLVLAATLAASTASAASHVKAGLVPTGKDPDARGHASAVVRGSKGKLAVSAHRLSSTATFEVIVDGVRIGTLSTHGGGNGKARFSTRPHGGDQLLGVDPRGKLLQVRDEDGDDVLETEMPDDSAPGAIRCCRSHEDETECEAESPDECAAKGGMNMGAGSCMPNPCPMSGGDRIRCCVPEQDEDGPECEDRTADECSAEHGINIGPGECEDDDACSPTSPGDGEIRCCIAEHDIMTHHEDGDDQGEDEDVECEHVSEASCAALGGRSLGAGSCDPNPCVASPSGAFVDGVALP
jgi:hypothetical protein